MNATRLQQWIARPEELNKESLYSLRTLLTRYPYSQTLRLLYLKNLYLLHDVAFGSELRQSALYIADRRVLFYLIEGDKYLLPKFSPVDAVQKEQLEETGLNRTLSLIETFLSANAETTAMKTELDYAVDYTTYLMDDPVAEESVLPILPSQPEPLKGQELIDGFLAKSKNESSMKLKPLSQEQDATVEGPALTHQEALEEDAYFTETLAKIYIKQRRYSKALEIIKKLSLKYPKKNIYFADQIRFLEKLIINANS